ncbi:MAG: succinylglutamate desuccinylase/aspartoacylase family protein [Proteobacteria bacterium]|nr:succinylglutamate desuccinylase/aspartoacylase family protein [Pseudomonadota bacterium]
MARDEIAFDAAPAASLASRRSKMDARPSDTPIVTPFSFDKPGKQGGALQLYHSNETNGYGYVPIPIVSIKNGEGPTALLIGGNHGNEYEGIVGLMNLAREIDPAQVQGRIIIVPALNFPAVKAGTRSSPLDDSNLNRSFPGDAAGSPTQMIAHYVSTALMPLADVVVDLHAGGRSSDFVPCVLVRRGGDSQADAELARLAEWFGAPLSFLSDGKGGGGGRTLSAECMRQGIPCLTAELGGGETLSQRGLKVAIDGVRRILDRLGILSAGDALPQASTRWVKKGLDNRIHAPEAGIFEPRIELEDMVAAGQPVGLIHFPDFPMRKPEELLFPRSGYVLALHIPALVSRGDELCTFVEDMNC